MHSDRDADAMSRLSMSTRLRKAVELKQWTLHYQPLIELDTGDMYGVEALIRWPEPNGGLVPPGEFIPLAEEMGLIEAIGDWVVEEICRQDAQWRAEGLTLEIGFNLSPRQLWQPELVDKIVSPIVVAGMDPTRVTVEITESTAMTDPDRTVELLDGDPRPGAQARDRRLRHRLLLAGAAQAHARRHPEDRSVVHPRRRQGPRIGEHGERDDLARREPGHDPARRRHRDRGRMALPGFSPLHVRTGVLLLASSAGAGDPAMHRRSGLQVLDGGAG